MEHYELARELEPYLETHYQDETAIKLAHEISRRDTDGTTLPGLTHGSENAVYWEEYSYDIVRVPIEETGLDGLKRRGIEAWVEGIGDAYFKWIGSIIDQH